MNVYINSKPEKSNPWGWTGWMSRVVAAFGEGCHWKGTWVALHVLKGNSLIWVLGAQVCSTCDRYWWSAHVSACYVSVIHHYVFLVQAAITNAIDWVAYKQQEVSHGSGNKSKIKVPGWSGFGEAPSGLQRDAFYFTTCEGVGEASGVPFIRSLTPLMRDPPSWANYLPKNSLANRILLGLRLQHVNRGSRRH